MLCCLVYLLVCFCAWRESAPCQLRHAPKGVIIVKHDAGDLASLDHSTTYNINIANDPFCIDSLSRRQVP